MENKKAHILSGLLYILATIALTMAFLFPVLLFVLPLLMLLLLFFQIPNLQIHTGYLFQIRSVCKIE